jgi:hypothetical protein
MHVVGVRVGIRVDHGLSAIDWLSSWFSRPIYSLNIGLQATLSFGISARAHSNVHWLINPAQGPERAGMAWGQRRNYLHTALEIKEPRPAQPSCCFYVR